MEPEVQKFGVLRPEFQGEYFRRMGLGRVGFADWCRHEKKPPMSFNESHWPKMMNGDPVSWLLLEALSEYVSDRLMLGRYPVSRIAEVVPPPTPEIPPGINVWPLGFAGMLTRISLSFRMHEKSFCRNAADIQDAARLVVADVGLRHSTGVLSEEAAIRAGEEVMHRTLSQYAAQLESWWKFNPRTVMFAVRREKNKPFRRVGVAVVVPVTKTFYQRKVGGEANDLDLTPAEIVYPSSFIHVNAAAEIREPSQKRLMAIGQELFHTGCYQIAMLTPDLCKHVDYPSIVSFAGTKVNERRIEQTGYADSGHAMPKIGKRVYALSAENGVTFNGHYWSLYGVIRTYQSALVRERAEVDATD